MTNDEKIFDDVESYILGSMPTDERANFERQLATDDELQNLVNIHRGITELSVDAGVLELKNKLKKGHFSANRWAKVWPWLGLGVLVVLAGLYGVLSLKQPVVLPQSAKEQQAVSMVVTEKQIQTKTPQVLNIPSKELSKPKTVNNTKTTLLEKSQIKNLDSVPLQRTPFQTPVLQKIDQPLPAGLPTVKAETHMTKENPTEAPGKVQEQPQIPVRKKDFMFQPNLGETWNFPIPEDKVGEIKIFDSQGQQIFESVIGKGHLSEWHGTNQSGAIVSAGNYVYLLSMEKEIHEGTITVVK